MSNQHLATYLNDHRAGSVAALELLRHLDKEQEERILNQMLAGLRADIPRLRNQLPPNRHGSKGAGSG